jgi:hypothetical protein
MMALGLVHICFAFPLEADTYMLWFVGAGMAIIFAGLLNLVALDRGGSAFTITVAVMCNTAVFAGFLLAIPILNQPQVYIGMVLFLAAAICFLLLRLKRTK